MYAVLLGVGFHPRGDVHCVSEEAVAQVAGAHHVRNNGPRVKAHTDVYVASPRILIVDERLVGRLDGSSGEARDTSCVVVHLVLYQVGDSHVGITDRLHFEDAMVRGQPVKLGVEPV
eukprot:CAMPEP_0179204542 /NCGR_PEP_ID=MMETSP0796-20121207/101967_1 /TAXON_ID=73915 /ORGANISM="Pyrodinium bahamense, Strain pbaha01" /LENGTH=116 /DNA_ID=CAMNT_0020909423 /DNA_START=44 /DNA_END=394 /DNA_ORIENTATION=-